MYSVPMHRMSAHTHNKHLHAHLHVRGRTATAQCSPMKVVGLQVFPQWHAGLTRMTDQISGFAHFLKLAVNFVLSLVSR